MAGPSSSGSAGSSRSQALSGRGRRADRLLGLEAVDQRRRIDQRPAAQGQIRVMQHLLRHRRAVRRAGLLGVLKHAPVGPDAHRQLEADFVAPVPGPLDAGVGARLRGLRQQLAVELQPGPFGPGRDAQLQGKAGAVALDVHQAQADQAAERILRVLLPFHAAGPGQLRMHAGGPVQVDGQAAGRRRAHRPAPAVPSSAIAPLDLQQRQ